VLQGEGLPQPCFFGLPVFFNVFPAFGESHDGQQGDNDNLEQGIVFVPLDPWVFDMLKEID
jgi:hypothetical protein